MLKFKIAYLGIDLLLPVFEATLSEGCEVLKVFTCPTDNITEFNTGVIALAKEHGIPYTVDRITIDDLKELQTLDCNLLICAGYYYRIPVFNTITMVNVHPSYLPIGRGAWPMPVSILRGMPYGGVTFHVIDSGFDTGDILLQEKFPLTGDDTLGSYMDKLVMRIPDMVHRLLYQYEELIRNATPQGQGEYWNCPQEADWTVKESMTVSQADLILRAFWGYECIYESRGERYEVIGARAVQGSTAGQQFPFCDGYLVTDRCRRIL